jgi:hypothetical protein
MQNPAYQPLYADRYNPFIATLTFQGKDLTACALHAQVRPKVNATTGALATLAWTTNVAATGFMLLNTVTVGTRIDTVVRMCITQADLANFITSLDEDDVFARYEIKITEADGFTENVWAYGPFVIRAGVDNA